MGRPKRAKRLNPEAEKLRTLLKTIDRLREAGFIRHHVFINDTHKVEFTARGLALVQAVKEVEAALPDLSAGERTGLWHLLRMVEWTRGNPEVPALLAPPPATNRDEAAVSQQLAAPPLGLA